ncbi:kinesin-like protein KIF28 [Montipora capricornis]|uniref:kinesin-like protein KIF28 n=1 Tax=Montipora capricornis TaxID=246305 RepID=UPI0035F1688C
MVGYGNNKGIVPITCDELFKIVGNAAADVKHQVSFSMLEIYNEQVRDLLVKSNPKGGLQVRQNPKEGSFFVQNLKRVAVVDYPDIERRIEEGTANRTVAATQMNATSSRAHTVVTIVFDQISKNQTGQETKKSSNINLVDLAGSERADSTGATGDRLKEGANINKSLSALGNVISALADLSMGKKKVLVPYRDSVLTKLLQNALGGNSKTIMIAALSPADINYDETLSTLRYADRAKKIKNKAVVNENPMDKLVRELREENERLKKMFESGGMPTDVGGAGMSDEEKEEMRKKMREELLAQMEFNNQNMMSWDEKVEMSRSEAVDSGQNERQKKKQTIPHLINLNEDPQLSRVIVHFLEQANTKIGRKDADPVPDIPFSGLSILKQHALIKSSNGEISIEPASPGAKTKVNGIPLTGERVLKHFDRILFGSNHMYILINPANTEKTEGTPDDVDWEFAQKEIAQAKGFATGFGSGLSKDQQRAQEQVLEVLPLVSEVNAMSEELNKHKNFEVILISGVAQGEGGSAETKVMVRMKNLLNNNVWLWDRGKFLNRRFLMQDLYQRSMDGEDLSKLPKEEDPFWEPPEDVLIGTASVFLQSLSYALDFDDKLAITDYKGEEVATVVINVAPCYADQKPLSEEFFVDDPSELLAKDYHYKVTIRNATVHDAKFNKGLYIKYKPFRETDFTTTKTVEGTLSPEFNHSTVFHFDSITPEHLEWFDTGCIAFQLYGRQEDSDPDAARSRMTTKELRQMEMQIARPGIGPRSTTMVNADTSSAQLKAELILLKRKNLRLEKKEKRIQDLCEEWGKKPPEEQSFEAFHRAVSAAAAHQSGKLKYKVNMLMGYLKDQNGTTANGGQIKMDPKVAQGSRACSVM